MTATRKPYPIAIAGKSVVHPAGIEPATSGLGNHSARSNLAQFGQFYHGAVPVWHNDAQGREPLSVQGVRRGNGMTLAARARLIVETD